LSWALPPIVPKSCLFAVRRLQKNASGGKLTVAESAANSRRIVFSRTMAANAGLERAHQFLEMT